MRSLEDKLGKHFNRIEVSFFLNEVAREVRKEFTDWIDDLTRMNDNSIQWWFRNLSSRNIYVSNVFLFCCYAELITRLCDDSELRPNLIIVESTCLAKFLMRSLVLKGQKCKLFLPPLKHIIECIYWWYDIVSHWSYACLQAFARYLAAKLTVGQQKEHPSHPIVLDTFVFDSHLTDDGKFTDKFFPHLHEYLASEAETVLVHPVLVDYGLNFLPVYKKMRRSTTHFLIAEDYLTFDDYCTALSYPLHIITGKVKNENFRDFDLSQLFREEETGSTIASGIQAFLIYRLFIRLKDILHPKLLIDWYENQIIDKASIGGFRKAFPEVHTIGAQIFIHSDNALNLFPTPYEIESELAPHEIVTMGKFQCNIINEFAGEIACSNGASLRYIHVFDENTEEKMEKLNRNSIVVLLPQDMGYSVEILDNLTESLNSLQVKMPILIKSHPTIPENRIISSFGVNRWPSQFEFYGDSLSSILKKALLVISSNSSALIEALVKGMPVVSIVQQTQIYQDLLYNVDAPHAFKCHNSNELLQCIEKICAITDEERSTFREKGEELRSLYFTPLSEETLAPFLPHEKGKI